jgi:polyferredoxin
MVKIGKPTGLIRYGSRNEFEGRPSSGMRTRIVVYAAALAIGIGLFVWLLGSRASAEITVLRGLGAPYVQQPDGSVVNQVRLKIANRGREQQRYRIGLEGAPDARVIAPINPLPVPAGETRTTSVFVILTPASFVRGERPVRVTIEDGARPALELPYRLLGPDHDEDDEARSQDVHRGERHR